MAGVYIHIPFCKQACHYCNFYFSTSVRQKDTLLQALIKEIRLTVPYTPDEHIETIYFGGGTPSLLHASDLKQILDVLHQQFIIDKQAEITLEANPDDLHASCLEAWKSIGINRLSIGIQSFDNAELAWMNRTHTAQESLQTLERITEAGFTNYSIDLIFGSPLLTHERWKQHVAIAIEKQVPHISCYALTVEPQTALDSFIRKRQQPPVDPDKQAEQLLLLMQWMEDAGYEQYEISNFAKPSMRSRHNSSYWQGKYYYGFGPSAHSFNGKSRRWNVANNALYIRSIEEQRLPFEEEVLTRTQQINEYIMVALRTMEGIDLSYVEHISGRAARQQLETACRSYIKGEKIVCDASRLILTKEGKLLADGIAAALFFD